MFEQKIGIGRSRKKEEFHPFPVWRTAAAIVDRLLAGRR